MCGEGIGRCWVNPGGMEGHYLDTITASYQLHDSRIDRIYWGVHECSLIMIWD